MLSVTAGLARLIGDSTPETAGYHEPMMPAYTPETLTRTELEARVEPLLLVFGTNWCGHCQAAGEPIAQALQHWPQLALVAVEDGPGRPLGRSFRVKLWPTLVLLQQGEELGRLVRPVSKAQVQDFLAGLLPGA